MEVIGLDQEKIGNLIKDLRKKNNLTQKQFADKYNVTYQAVSKWENAKNIPDISLLKQICDDYNIDIKQLLEGKETKLKKKKKKIINVLLVVILIITILLTCLYLNKEGSKIKHKTLTSECANFKISGNIAYNSAHSYLYIPLINYCGNEDNTLYKSIECKLYEIKNNTKKSLASSIYDKQDKILLKDYLEEVVFDIDNFSNECKTIKEGSLVLEINGIEESGKITTYQIPLSLSEECS